jgi:GntR family transcriptional regulator
MWLSLNEQDNRPLYLQILSQVKEQVRRGSLRPGDELPSVRELAQSLGVNMHTVRSAYLRLRDQGIINLRLGRRATVARRRAPADTAEVAADLSARLEELVTDALLQGLTPGDIRRLVERQLGQKNEK